MPVSQWRALDSPRWRSGGSRDGGDDVAWRVLVAQWLVSSRRLIMTKLASRAVQSWQTAKPSATKKKSSRLQHWAHCSNRFHTRVLPIRDVDLHWSGLRLTTGKSGGFPGRCGKKSDDGAPIFLVINH